MSLVEARRFEISNGNIHDTDQALREAGDDGYERFVLWSGILAGEVAQVRTIHVPTQTAYKTSQGLLVRVDGEALHRFNSWLYEHGESLLVQVHAHPMKAYHSETDNAYPIVTTIGSLSIVAARFGRNGVLGKGTASYRLNSSGWERIRPRALRKLLRVV